jgi:hypothetical protein
MRGIRTSVDHDPGRPLTTKVPTETWLAFTAIAEAHGLKPSAILRGLVQNYVRGEAELLERLAQKEGAA